MPCFRLTLEYDGEGYAGWQLQPGGERTLQGTLEAAVERVTGERVRVTGAGRTDAGVHAEGQVAGLRLFSQREPEALARALNGVLPEDFAVLSAEVVPVAFHARFDARSKQYRYEIWNGPVRSPARRRRSPWVSKRLDVEAMRRAAAHFGGTHDFACLQAAGGGVEDSVRTLSQCEIEAGPGAELRVWAEADGFLRHMVRNLVGTLLEVGRERRSADEMPALLAGRDRRAAGPTAPARGRTLVCVRY